MPKAIILLCTLTSLLLTGCAVYKIDIHQGNVVTQEMLDNLTLGMPAQRVRFIMGTPLLNDTFHNRRWDYVYSEKLGRSERKQRRITLVFDEYDMLAGVVGDVTIGAAKPDDDQNAPDTTPITPIL